MITEWCSKMRLLKLDLWRDDDVLDSSSRLCSDHVSYCRVSSKESRSSVRCLKWTLGDLLMEHVLEMKNLMSHLELSLFGSHMMIQFERIDLLLSVMNYLGVNRISISWWWVERMLSLRCCLDLFRIERMIQEFICFLRLRSLEMSLEHCKIVQIQYTSLILC